MNGTNNLGGGLTVDAGSVSVPAGATSFGNGTSTVGYLTGTVHAELHVSQGEIAGRGLGQRELEQRAVVITAGVQSSFHPVVDLVDRGIVGINPDTRGAGIGH